MIFGVEGNVNVGKTTFIKQIANLNNYTIIEETKFPQNMSYLKRQMYYINSEIDKSKCIMDKSYIMDRTILSVYLYTIISNEFSINEINDLLDKIKNLIINNKILIPDQLYFIIYPFELINKNHHILGIEKNTQCVLVNYDYYLKYNLFFSNMLKNKKTKIIETKENRQIILSKCNFLYSTFKKNLPINNKVVLLDGAPAIGKTSIGKKQKNLNLIEEFKYKKYSLSDYSNQIESIVKRIKCLSMKNVLLDTSFLMGITHLFYSHKRTVSKEEKIAMIYEIISQVPLYLYTSKIIYLFVDKEILLFRKQNDKTKSRDHFNTNIKYLKEEINFYKKLNNKMGEISNIHMINANKSVDEIIKKINSIEDKEVLLVDLFYYILKCINEGEI